MMMINFKVMIWDDVVDDNGEHGGVDCVVDNEHGHGGGSCDGDVVFGEDDHNAAVVADDVDVLDADDGPR